MKTKLTKQQRKGLALKEYVKIIGPAWKKYLKITGPALKEYEKIVDLASKEYEKIRYPAYKEYLKKLEEINNEPDDEPEEIKIIDGHKYKLIKEKQ